MRLKNQEIAKLLAKEIFKPRDEDSVTFALQLFVETAVLPDDITGYFEDEIEDYILAYLNDKRLM